MGKLVRFFPVVSKFRYGRNRQSPLNAARRHWITFFQYNTPKKMVNLASLLLQFALKRPVVTAYPSILKVEPTSRCNLRCPGCIAHGTDFPIEEGDMPLALFKKICDELGDYLYKISLYITGEPLLNNQIYDMISYATQKRIGTVISTNFHAFNEDKAERMIDAGLSHIIVCLDGVTQEVYERYRVGGNLDRVLRNLDILTRKKKEKGSKLPFLEIQAVRTGWNEAELPRIAKIAKQLSADRFTIREDLRSYQPATKDRTCFWLWCTALITEKGVVIPCCASAWWNTPKKAFGDLRKNFFSEIWNGPRYVEARRIFSREGGEHDKGQKRSTSLCSTCNIFRCQRTSPTSSAT